VVVDNPDELSVNEIKVERKESTVQRLMGKNTTFPCLSIKEQTPCLGDKPEGSNLLIVYETRIDEFVRCKSVRLAD